MDGNNAPTSNGAPAPFRIAIVGGAIGGLATALFLDNVCRSPSHPIAVDVYEQASEYREIGAGVGIGRNAFKLLQTIPGVGEGMRAIQGQRGSAWFSFVRWDSGRLIVDVNGPDGGGDLAMARSEFLEVMLGVLRERGTVRLHTKKRLVSCKV